MYKLLRKTAVFLFIAAAAVQSVSAENDFLPAIKSGTIIKVLPREEINTAAADTGDTVSFINTQNLYLFEKNAIPENTVFYGIIEDIKEPVQGRDAAIKISIKKMITPDNKTYEVNGYLSGKNENGYTGGSRTQSAYYHKVYNHGKGFKPFLQAVPLNIYDMGRHVIIRPGTEFFIVTESDIILK